MAWFLPQTRRAPLDGKDYLPSLSVMKPMMLTPSRIMSSAICWLLSSASSYVNGTVLTVAIQQG
jgi:NAD(P)-dependent dehydrogenase (short-subunit alcohol dehydrogenase family)